LFRRPFFSLITLENKEKYSRKYYVNLKYMKKK